MPTIKPYNLERASAGFKMESYAQNLRLAQGKDTDEFSTKPEDMKSILDKLPNDKERIALLYRLSKFPLKHSFFNHEDFYKLLENQDLLKTTWQGKNLMHIACERGSLDQIKETALAYKKLNPFENPFSGPRRAWIFSKTPLDRVKGRQDIDSEEIEQFSSDNFQEWSWSIKNIVGYYFPALKKYVEREVFVGWNQAERHKSNVIKLAQLRALHSDITDVQIDNYQKISLEKNKMEEEIDDITEEIEDTEHVGDVNKLKATERKKKDELAKLKAQLVELGKVKGLAEIARLTGYVEKHEATQKSAKKTREDLKTIGATPLTLDTTDGARLDAAFVSADKFLETLQTAKAKRALIGGKSAGFTLPNNSELPIKLAQLGLVGDGKPDAKGKEYEWLRKTISGGRIVLLPNTPENQKLDPASITESEIEQNSNARGTVILTSGALGVYEAHKREIMSFLARGLNVMCFNYRGYGESTGAPNEESIHADIEAAYQYLKTLNIEDKDITVKSLCMSGAAGTRLAANHPGVNLLLDQTYTHIKEYLDLEIERILADFPLLKLVPDKYFTVRGWLARTLADSLSPNWFVQGDIANVNGRVGVIVTSEDVNTPVVQAVANIESLLASGNNNINLYPMPGEHADSWMDVKIRNITPDNFTAKTYTRKIPKDRKILKTQIRQGITTFKKATNDADRISALKTLEQLCTPEIIKSNHHERVQEALTRLYNDIGTLQKKLNGSLPNTSALPPEFIGRKIIDNFFNKTGHLRRLES